MRNLAFPIIAMGVAAVLLAGCGGSANIAVPTPLQPIAGAGIQPEIVWASDGGDGSRGRANGLQLAVGGQTVYVANSGGQAAAFAIGDGQTLWRSDTGHSLLSGPAVADNALFAGARDGRLLALSREDGHTLWQTRVGSEVIAAPAAGRDVVVIHTLDGRVVAYERASGNRLWTIERNVPNLTLRGASDPVIVGGSVYVGLDNGHVVAIDLDTGRLLWEQIVALPTGRTELERLVDIDAELQIAGDRLYTVSVGDTLAALALGSGDIVWKQDIASATGLAVGRQRVFTTDPDGVIHAVNRRTGAVAWTQDALKYRELSAPVMYHGYVVVGDYAGYLHWIDPATGRIVGRIDVLDSAIQTAPVVVGGRLLVLGSGGELAAVRSAAYN